MVQRCARGSFQSGSKSSSNRSLSLIFRTHLHIYPSTHLHIYPSNIAIGAGFGPVSIYSASEAVQLGRHERDHVMLLLSKRKRSLGKADSVCVPLGENREVT